MQEDKDKDEDKDTRGLNLVLPDLLLHKGDFVLDVIVYPGLIPPFIR